MKSDEIFGTFTVGKVLEWKKKQSEAPKKRVKKWLGKLPTECDICKMGLDTEFIDGRTKFGMWGFLCPSCHKAVGVGLGTGRGQRYVADKDGNYIKVEG